MASLRDALERCSVREGVITPSWFTARDQVWMVELLELHRFMVGGTRRELDERLAQLARGGGHAGLRLASSVLEADFPSEVVAAIGPREARAATFSLAADRPGRDLALARAAAALGVTPRVLDEALLADVPDQRRVKASNDAISADTLALRCNSRVAGALLASCSGLRIELEGANQRAA